MKIVNNINLKEAVNIKLHEKPWTTKQKKVIQLLGFEEKEIKTLRAVTEELENFFDKEIAQNLLEENQYVKENKGYYELKTLKAIEFESNKNKTEIKAKLQIFYSSSNGERIKKHLEIYLKLKGGE